MLSVNYALERLEEWKHPDILSSLRSIEQRYPTAQTQCCSYCLACAGQTNWIGQARLSTVLTLAFEQLNLLHLLSLPSGNASLAFLKLQLLILDGNSNSASKGVKLISVGRSSVPWAVMVHVLICFAICSALATQNKSTWTSTSGKTIIGPTEHSVSDCLPHFIYLSSLDRKHYVSLVWYIFQKGPFVSSFCFAVLRITQHINIRKCLETSQQDNC